MEFRLLYSGKLTVSSTLEEKHDVRRQFHPQLANLWNQNPTLHFAKDRGVAILVKNPTPSVNEMATVVSFDRYADLFQIGKFRFVPLIGNYFLTACSLDVLFLRPENHEPMVNPQTGDIDNRIKTLFDTLRIPKSKELEQAGLKPSQGEDPFYCLLDEDALISEFKITGDRLLIPPKQSSHWNNWVELVITVRIKTLRAMPLNQMFL